jgi:molybdopterin biosynthesis enzyme
VLAEGVIADGDRPARPLAWRDGWAVRAEATSDAGPYAPAALPGLAAIEVGYEMPPDADAVAMADAVRLLGDAGEALAPVGPGDGVLAAGADAVAGETICRAGHRIRITEAAALHALGISQVAVRAPQLCVTHVAGRRSQALPAAAAWIADAVARVGGVPVRVEPPTDDAGLDRVLSGDDSAMVILIGGTGAGRSDRSVRALARMGRVEAHGIGISPGETAAFGMVGNRPVLLVPGRLDAAFAVWLTLGRRILACLCGCAEPDPVIAGTLTRKVASSVGLAEVVPVRLAGRDVTPLASGHLPLSVLAHANGWITVPAESEGFAAGGSVDMRPLP